MAEQAKVQQWNNDLQAAVAANSTSGAIYEFSVVHDEEEKVYEPMVKSIIHGVSRKTTLRPELFKSQEYRNIIGLGQSLSGLFEPGAFVKRGDKTQPVSDFKQALDWLMKEAMKGVYLQRYKGLGEMNPDQLWETTMDPQFRRMTQVTIEDAMGADQLFSTLMGDQVEPRRDFIETNALNVANLDV
jgi:DNA gyrase subunit B